MGTLVSARSFFHGEKAGELELNPDRKRDVADGPMEFRESVDIEC